MFRWDLGNFEQANLTLVIDESSTLFCGAFSVIRGRIRVERNANLDISLGLVSDLHEEFSVGVNHVLEDPLIDTDMGGQPVPARWFNPTYTAPRLSEFETNRYSFPSAIN